jgi:hypothetical protein
MQRTHGRAAAGKRVVSKVPHGHWKIIITVAAMTTRGMAAAASFDGATDRELFVTFVRESLLPVLEPVQSSGRCAYADDRDGRWWRGAVAG